MSKIAVNEITDEVGTGAPAFPNGMSVTGAALTDPEITGGIYLGGTGSANYLDDYEEGTFTCVVSAGSDSRSNIGNYTKIGRLVKVHSTVSLDITSSSRQTLNLTLPFTISGAALHDRSAPTIGVATNIEFVNGMLAGHGNAGSSSFSVFVNQENGNPRRGIDVIDGQNISLHFSFTYFTDS